VRNKPIREWEEEVLDRELKTVEKLRQEGVIPLPRVAEQEAVWDRYLTATIEEVAAWKKAKRWRRLNSSIAWLHCLENVSSSN